MAGSEPVALIYNPVAGTRLQWRIRRTPQQAASALADYGGEVRLLATRAPGDALRLAADAACHFPVVAVMGGDGTINEVINGLVASGRPARVLLLPAGSVNVLARDLGIPLDPLRAAALLRDGTARRVFLGRAASRYFAMMAGAGLDASIVRALAGKRVKRVLGPLAFILEGLRHAATYRFPRLHIRWPAGETDGHFAVIGNSPGYGGWFSITPGADPAQPGFQVAVFRSPKALRYFYYLAMSLVRALPRCPDVVYFNAARVEVKSDAPAWVQIDGETFEPLPMEFVCDGASLDFLVPKSGLMPATTDAISPIGA